jgi:hypothetical protein
LQRSVMLVCMSCLQVLGTAETQHLGKLVVVHAELAIGCEDVAEGHGSGIAISLGISLGGSCGSRHVD